MNKVYFNPGLGRWNTLDGSSLVRLALLSLMLFLFGFCNPVFSERCPSAKVAKSMIKKVFNRDVNIIKVRHSPIAGLCEVQTKSDGKFGIIYTDNTGKYLIPASILRVSDRSNLTQKTISLLNRFSSRELKQLDSLAAFTAGAGKTIYFIAGPQCPYCRKAESILKPLIDARIIEVKFILFPLSFHKGAKEQSVSTVCDNKGFEGLMSGYRSKNQCQRGKDKIEKTIIFLEHKGITGVPTYIFPDGLYHTGVLLRQELKRRLKIK